LAKRLPHICHPGRVRRRIRKHGRILTLVAWILVLTGLFWPVPTSRGGIVPLEELTRKPVFSKRLSRLSQEKFFRTLHQTNRLIKGFFADLDISQEELLNIKISTIEKKNLQYIFYKADFFLESHHKGAIVRQRFYEKLEKRWPETVKATLANPMPHFLSLHIEIEGKETHAITFYFPAPPKKKLKFKRWLPSSTQWFQKSKKEAKIAFVIDDLGDDWQAITKIMSLDASITLAVLPETPFARRAFAEGKKAGNPLFLHLPMEPEDQQKMHSRFLHPRNFLKVQMDYKEIENFLNNHADLLSHCSGLNNHMGSRFTKNSQRMTWVLNFLKRKNLFYLDSRTSDDTMGYYLAKELGLKTAIRDVFLDHHADRNHIQEQFRLLRRIARKKGHVVVIGHPFRETLSLLEEEIPRLKSEGFTLVPVTQL